MLDVLEACMFEVKNLLKTLIKTMKIMLKPNGGHSLRVFEIVAGIRMKRMSVRLPFYHSYLI